MWFKQFYLTVCMITFAQGISALPHTFERAVIDTTGLASSISSIQSQLGPLLSKGATLYFPGTSDFENATSR